MNYSVYKHTSPNGKVYIGVTKRRPSKRFDRGRGYSHCPHMRAAIAKYGWDSFEHDILASGLSKEEAEQAEIYFISSFKSADPDFGYNIAKGGYLTRGLSPEGRAKLSAQMRGDLNPARVYGSPMKGKKHTEEAKKKMSISASKRHTPCSEETKLKLRLGHAFEEKPVLCIETNNTYSGIHAAAEATGCTATKICAVCKGKRHTTGGFHWRYA